MHFTTAWVDSSAGHTGGTIQRPSITSEQLVIMGGGCHIPDEVKLAQLQMDGIKCQSSV